MGLQLTLLLMKICITLSAMQVDGSSVRVSWPPRGLPTETPTAHPIGPGQPPLTQPDPAPSLTRTPPSSGRTRNGELAAAPSSKVFHHSSSINHSPTKALHPQPVLKPSSIAVAPSASSFGSPARDWMHGPASSPSLSFYKHDYATKGFSNSAPEPSYLIHQPADSQQVPAVSPSQYSIPSWVSPAPALSPTDPSRHFNMPTLQPAISPVGSSLENTKGSPAPVVMALPPPPPNKDCTSVACTEPLTYTPSGSPCGCVWPIQVKLRLGVAIYTFFPLVSELAQEIAASVRLNHSQVRIMGANAASQELEKSTVLINLVPWEVKFDSSTSLLIYKKFWNRHVFIKPSLFGSYEVVYVRYPGLPASPPAASSSASAIDDGPYSGHDNHGEAVKPLGVDVPRKKTNGIRQSMIAVIILSCFSAFVVCLGIIWLILLKYGACVNEREHLPQAIKSSPEKPSGAGAMMQGSTSSAASMSIGSKGLTYTGLAKNFTLNDLERATNSFDASRVIGEGGFGVVYRGILDDGAPVAVKVLKREDKRGGQEFLAEVEMLSRLHHRNLVKLIGICTEDNIRCLVYELVPNGSLESHLHGVDKETGPLDWGARMKIALGAARGLAYLHEDSSPRVIHRDFKSSNILLEHDFTPKVSDFGLARTALDEGNKYISTHVMGTFGYLAPEYAMTGHLLVKSDVYSYGVVLLELLTGRKPVDLSQPPGQENLVAWARPLLTATEGFETVIDPAIKSDVSFDSIAKVAAIASMCVQPEVSHRPFMGEVVQALKLVCNEFDEKKEVESKVCVQEDFPTTVDSLVSRLSSELVEASDTYHQVRGCDFSHGSNIALSASDFLSIPMGLEEQEPGSFRRHSCSGPVGTGRRSHFWQRIRSLSRGSRSEHGFSVKFWPGSR
ncbi:receptor-like serine/threonine-protein kinase ALE2 isoform X1 [Herrania umbratica]|uniref:Receptor-like serine/threonine-protein kinase ALE2 isoform X1 n=2 Tax=Herrania umbratica TaxID=108875 RepID=A0A6J1B3S4_9ROSI|nr:receptor-like serine/threonine-protein kinase ALE2 isoform X1 [Herrania umbratica]